MRFKKWKELTKDEKKELILKGVIFAAGVGLGVGGSRLVRGVRTNHINRNYTLSNAMVSHNKQNDSYYIQGYVENPKNGKRVFTDWTFGAADGSLEGLKKLFEESAETVSEIIADKNADKFNEALTDAVEAIGKEK